MQRDVRRKEFRGGALWAGGGRNVINDAREEGDSVLHFGDAGFYLHSLGDFCARDCCAFSMTNVLLCEIVCKWFMAVYFLMVCAVVFYRNFLKDIMFFDYDKCMRIF